MADMDLKLLIGGDSKEAQEALSELEKEFDSLNKSSEKTSKNLDDARKKVDDVGKTSISATSNINSLSSSFKKLGSDLSNLGSSATMLMAPFTALGALSLKNLFDEGMKDHESAYRDFAESVTTLKITFQELGKEVGEKIIPTIQPLINFATNTAQAFRELSPEVKDLIVNFGLIATAISPTLFVFGKLFTALSSLAPVLTTIGGVFATFGNALFSMGTIAIGVGATLAGLVNVFFKLKESGSDSATALSQTWGLFADGFNNYITKNILRSISLMSSALGEFLGMFSDKLESKLNEIAYSASKFSDQLEDSFEESKNKIDSQLSSIGSSAGDAFTFGFNSKIPEMIKKFQDAFKSQNVDLGIKDKVKKEMMSATETFAWVKKQIDALKAKIAELEAQIEKEKKSATETFAWGKKQIDALNISMENNLTDGFASMIEGTKSVAQAFSDMTKQILADLLRIAIRQQVVGALAGVGGFASGGLVAQKNASGGFIRGKGTGTSDSILSWLSNGEYVIKASSVKKVGTGFLDYINNLGSGANLGAKGFANGGKVNGGGGVSVSVTNNGTPKDVVGADFNPETMVVSVILNDLNRNGSIAKGISNTFGNRRTSHI